VVQKVCDLVERLAVLPDPRRQCANLKHQFVDVLVLGLCGVLADCDDFVQIAAWANLHLDFFRTFLELPNGIPSHDTLTRVFALAKPATLQSVLVPWLQQRRGLPGEWIHLDGKAMRRTRRASTGLKNLHVVSAWASQSGLTLGQVAVDSKSNEITAFPQLLELLDLRDKVVTIDAMGCQKDIAAAVVAGGGDYVLAVKDNQPTLHADIQAVFAAQEAASPSRRGVTTVEEGHGRLERRTVRVLPASTVASHQPAWLGLLTLVMVASEVTCQATGVVSREVRYFISSLTRPSARRMGQIIRSHWSIENGLHWVLDVVFHEDARRVYDRAVAENTAFLNRLAVSLLRGDPSKDSLTVKRKRAGWDVRYLAQLLGFHGS
jgi:predicted transposase YbfD/YdcC